MTTSEQTTPGQAQAPWQLPPHLEPYRDLINGTGGISIEGLVNELRTDNRLSYTNTARFAMAMGVHAQIGLLDHLHGLGLLPPDDEAARYADDRRAARFARGAAS